MTRVSNLSLPFVLALCLCVWFVPIGMHKLLNPDEGRYSEIPREMVASNDWLTPRLDGIIYLEKPPLQYWATAVIYSIFGESEWTARLWVALSGFLSVLLTGWLALRVYGARVAMFAAAVHAGSLLHAALAHLSTLDATVSLLLQVSLSGLVLLADDRHHRTHPYLAPALIACGSALAFLAKGVVGIFFPSVVLLIFCMVRKEWGPLWRAKVHWAIGLTALIGGSWALAVALKYPAFAKFFFIHEHFERFLTRVHDRYQPPWFFIPIVLIGFMPWTFFLLQTAKDTIRSIRSRDRMVLMLFIWAIFIFVFFSISQSKLVPYILPIVPALALLTGKTLSEMKAEQIAKGLAMAGAMLVILALAAILIHVTTSRLEIALGDAVDEMLAAFLLGGLIVIAASLICRRHEVLGLWSAALGTIVLPLIALNAAQLLPEQREEGATAVQAVAAADPETNVYCVGEYVQTIAYYLKRPCVLVDYKGELEFGQQLEPQRSIPNLGVFMERWRAEDDALAVTTPVYYRYMQSIDLPMRVISSGPHIVLIARE